jgi:hypothetical protein
MGVGAVLSEQEADDQRDGGEDLVAVGLPPAGRGGSGRLEGEGRECGLAGRPGRTSGTPVWASGTSFSSRR